MEIIITEEQRRVILKENFKSDVIKKVELFKRFNFSNNIRFEIFFQNNPLLFLSYNNLHIYM